MEKTAILIVLYNHICLSKNCHKLATDSSHLICLCCKVTSCSTWPPECSINIWCQWGLNPHRVVQRKVHHALILWTFGILGHLSLVTEKNQRLLVDYLQYLFLSIPQHYAAVMGTMTEVIWLKIRFCLVNFWLGFLVKLKQLEGFWLRFSHQGCKIPVSS